MAAGSRCSRPRTPTTPCRSRPTASTSSTRISRADLPTVSVIRRSDDGRVVKKLEKADLSQLTAMGWRSRTVQGQGGRRQDRSLRAHLAADELRSEEEVSGDREHLHRPAGGVRAEDVCRVSPPAAGDRRARVHHRVRRRSRHGAALARLSRAYLLQPRARDPAATITSRCSSRWRRSIPYMDLDRVGVWGHSAGGYDSTHAILTHPEFYKVAVSSAGCHDNRMDKATWNEQWMGWPVDKHYEEQSNYTLAPSLQGKLFLAHGDVDENVPLPATIKLVDALVTRQQGFRLPDHAQPGARIRQRPVPRAAALGLLRQAPPWASTRRPDSASAAATDDQRGSTGSMSTTMPRLACASLPSCSAC